MTRHDPSGDGIVPSDGFFEALAGAIEAATHDDAATQVIDLLAEVVTFQSSLIVIYHETRRPIVLHDGLANPDRRNSARQYVDGAYLLDPFYNRALRSEEPCLLGFSDIAQGNATLSAYSESYYRLSHVSDEINYLIPLDRDFVVAISLERAVDRERFSPSDISKLQSMLPVVTALVRSRLISAIEPELPADDRGHRTLEARLRGLGGDRLSDRERAVTNLLLRGLSVTQIAYELDIAAETARVHRRNTYRKLSVSSIAELFALAFEHLEKTSDGRMGSEKHRLA